MQQSELVAAAMRGERVQSTCSLHEREDPTACAGQSDHRFRVIACDETHDVIECYRCGHQMLIECTFTEGNPT